MTEQKLVEILENHSYDISVMPRSNTIFAGKTGCAEIVAVESGKTVTGWAFQVGKNTIADVDTAIKYSKKGIIS